MAESWYWCLKHNRVEPTLGCPAKERLGPFATQAEAERALDTVHEREKRFDAEDEAWNEGRRS